MDNMQGIKTGPVICKTGGDCMSKFIYSFGIILFGLSLGYMTQVLVRRDRVTLPIDLDALRLLLQRIALLFVNPVSSFVQYYRRRFVKFQRCRPTRILRNHHYRFCAPDDHHAADVNRSGFKIQKSS